MESEKEFDINDIALALDVDIDLIDKVRKGEVTHIVLDIDDEYQDLILESDGESLLLTIDEMPATYCGCYLYNNGEFPYAIRNDLSFLILNGGEDGCLARIIGVNTEPGTRFKYQGADKPPVEDANGDCCVWKIVFEVVPVPAEPKTYLMRWNPSISSFTEKDYEECIADMVHGMFRMNWSISEWEEARIGDFFYMMRVGDDKAGIVFHGQFISDPYPADDWAGSTKRRMYVDMICMGAVPSGSVPPLSLEKLKAAIPAINWSRGSSGVLLEDDTVETLDKMWELEP